MSAKIKKLAHRNIDDFVVVLPDNERYSGDVQTSFGFAVDTYDIPELQEKIVDAECILTALVGVVTGKNKDKVDILEGFRRTVSAQRLKAQGKNLAAFILENFPALFFNRDAKTGNLTMDRNDRDPEVTAANLLKNLEKVPVELYDSLTAQEREEVIHDKGKEKRIRKAETWKGMTQLATKGFSEKQICRIMYHQFGDVLQNAAKAEYISSITDPRKRDLELTKWLHGTIGGFWMSTWGHSRRMRDNMELTFLAQDGKIPKNASGDLVKEPEFYMSQTRWRQLMKALKEDASNKVIGADGKVVTEDSETSPAFEILVSKFHAEDFEGAAKSRAAADNRIKADMLAKMAKQDNYDPVAKTALLVAAGMADGAELVKLSSDNLRNQGVIDILRRTVDFIPKNGKFTGAQVNDLVNGIIRDLPMEFAKVVIPFLNKEGQELLAGQTVAPTQTTATVAAK